MTWPRLEHESVTDAGRELASVLQVTMPGPWISLAAKNLAKKDPGGGGGEKEATSFPFSWATFIEAVQTATMENFTMDYRCKQYSGWWKTGKENVACSCNCTCFNCWDVLEWDSHGQLKESTWGCACTVAQAAVARVSTASKCGDGN